MVRSWKAQARSTASSTYSSGFTSIGMSSKYAASPSFWRWTRSVMFHFLVMALLLIWRGVILTVREKRSLFGHAGRRDAQLGADHVGGLFGHGTQGGSLSAGDSDQPVNVMRFLVVITIEGTRDAAS